MASGRLGTANLTAATNTSVYTVDRVHFKKGVSGVPVAMNYLIHS